MTVRADDLDTQSDVLAAFLARWQAQALSEHVPGGIHQPPVPRDAKLAFPYATVEARESSRRKREHSVLSAIDYTDLEVIVRHKDKTALGPIAKAILAAMDEQQLEVSGWMRTEENPHTIRTPKQRKQGEEVHELRLLWTVWRQIPSIPPTIAAAVA